MAVLTLRTSMRSGCSNMSGEMATAGLCIGSITVKYKHYIYHHWLHQHNNYSESTPDHNRKPDRDNLKLKNENICWH